MGRSPAHAVLRPVCGTPTAWERVGHPTFCRSFRAALMRDKSFTGLAPGAVILASSRGNVGLTMPRGSFSPTTDGFWLDGRRGPGMIYRERIREDMNGCRATTSRCWGARGRAGPAAVVFPGIGVRCTPYSSGFGLQTFKQSQICGTSHQNAREVGLVWGVFLKKRTQFFDGIKPFHNKGLRTILWVWGRTKQSQFQAGGWRSCRNAKQSQREAG